MNENKKQAIGPVLLPTIAILFALALVSPQLAHGQSLYTTPESIAGKALVLEKIGNVKPGPNSPSVRHELKGDGTFTWPSAEAKTKWTLSNGMLTLEVTSVGGGAEVRVFWKLKETEDQLQFVGEWGSYFNGMLVPNPNPELWYFSVLGGKEVGKAKIESNQNREGNRPYNGRYGLRDATLLPDIEGGYEALAKKTLSENGGDPFLAFKAIKDARDRLWMEKGAYRTELVLADHYLVAYASQFPGAGLMLEFATSTPGIAAYEGVKLFNSLIGQTVNPQSPNSAPQSPPSISAIEAVIRGKHDGYFAVHGVEPPTVSSAFK